MRGNKHGFLWDTDVYFDNSNYRLSIVLRGPAHPCRLTACNVERTELKRFYHSCSWAPLCCGCWWAVCQSAGLEIAYLCHLLPPTNLPGGFSPLLPSHGPGGQGPQLHWAGWPPCPLQPPSAPYTVPQALAYLCGSSDQEDSQGCSVDCLLTEVPLPHKPPPTPHPPPWASVLEPAGDLHLPVVTPRCPLTWGLTLAQHQGTCLAPQC